MVCVRTFGHQPNLAAAAPAFGCRKMAASHMRGDNVTHVMDAMLCSLDFIAEEFAYLIKLVQQSQQASQPDTRTGCREAPVLTIAGASSMPPRLVRIATPHRLPAGLSPFPVTIPEHPQPCRRSVSHRLIGRRALAPRGRARALFLLLLTAQEPVSPHSRLLSRASSRSTPNCVTQVAATGGLSFFGLTGRIERQAAQVAALAAHFSPWRSNEP
jgi:hypothetical protein